MNSIIEVIIKNKEWLFSGLGLSVIVLLYYLIRYLLSPLKLNKNYIDNSSSSDLPSLQILSGNQAIEPINTPNIMPNITPPQIYNAINNAPLLPQPDIAKHYIGIHVRWKGTVTNAYMKDNNMVRVSLVYEGKYPPHYISFVLNPDEVKNLTLLNEDDFMEVEGQITSVDGRNIELCDIRIISWSSKKNNTMIWI